MRERLSVRDPTRSDGRQRLRPGVCALLALAGLPLASPVLAAGDGKETQITINFTEMHDRLGPDPRPGITRTATIEATLSSDGQIHENNSDFIRAGRKNAAAGIRQNENEEKLGDTSAHVVWRVNGPHKLQRVMAGKQFVMVADVEVVQDTSCTVEIRYLLQKGYTEVVMRRRDNGEMAPFTLPKVLNSSCSIH